MHTDNTLWQVPESCSWNRYVEDGGGAIAEMGWSVLRPGVCEDGPAPIAAQTWDGPAPTVVHLHWPEKLARGLGSMEALSLLRSLKQRGSRIVQTIHNVSPHEPGTGDPWFQHTVDTLTDGVHFFSPEHELIAQANRPGLPAVRLVMPHPQYSSAPAARVGCFGRIRDYKRTADFAEALLADKSFPVQLVVIGHADSANAAARLQSLADSDSRLDYQPEFAAAKQFESAVASVDWVALPYRSLYSSGVLVKALQANRRVLSPRPAGGTELYGSHCSQQWLVIHPWTDEAAIREMSKAITARSLNLPEWAEAASRLTTFYTAIAAEPARPLLEEI